jgi:hypothetical protein
MLRSASDPEKIDRLGRERMKVRGMEHVFDRFAPQKASRSFESSKSVESPLYVGWAFTV